MQSSKARILAVLKRCGARSVDHLAADLQLAPMTVRQHLTGLERDGLVTVAERRNGAGRPRHLYSLTPEGDAFFPRRYDRFASMLLSELQDPGSPIPVQSGRAELAETVLDRLAWREALPHIDRLAAISGAGRARAAAAVLHEIGGFAEAIETPAGVEIRDYNCVYRGLRPHEHGPCPWHSRLVPLLLQQPVEHVPAVDDTGRCCRMLVPGELSVSLSTNHKE